MDQELCLKQGLYTVLYHMLGHLVTGAYVSRCCFLQKASVHYYDQGDKLILFLNVSPMLMLQNDFFQEILEVLLDKRFFFFPHPLFRLPLYEFLDNISQ